MQERQVTIEGETRPLAPPFVVLATQNPIEYEGTYPLPEAQLDRFLLRVGVGYPAREDEWRVLERRMERGGDEVELEPVVDRAQLVELQRALEQVHVSEPVGLYMVDLVAATRGSTRVQVGASPRGTLALLKLSRGKAALAGRDFVTPDDVKAVAVPALAHRLTLRPELWVQRVRGEDVVEEALRRGADASRRRRSRRDDALRRRSWRPTRRSARLGLAAALVLGRPEAVGLAAPFLLVLAVGLPLSRAPHLRAWVERERERVLEGEEIDVAVEVETDAPVERLELLLVLPRGLERRAEVEPAARCGSPATARSASRWRSGARTGARTRSATSCCAPTTGFGLAVHEARVDRREPLARLPAAGGAARPAAAARDAGLLRQPGARGRAARGSSSPTCGSSCRATGSGGSTGGRARGAASCG